jgi:hypothetical protein
MKRTWPVLFCVAACAADLDDTDCEGGKCDQLCADPRYDDGVCDLELSCAAPDLDCIRTFEDDAAAAAWLAAFEPRVAEFEGRPARSIVPLDDPRYPVLRELLDRGWDAMRDNRPVARLAAHRPALLLVEDPSVNAFVYPEDIDQKRAAFAVMVHTGLLEIPGTEDATLGLFMHELQHAVGLHVVAEVKASFKTFYVAQDGYEPIGRDQDDDPQVREHATRWLAHAGEVGPFSDVELRGLPAGGDLQLVFRHVLQAGLAGNPTGCQRTRTLLGEVASDLEARIDLLSGAPSLDAAFGVRVTQMLRAMREECVPVAPSFVEVVAELAGVAPAEIDAALTASDRALVTGRHVIDAIAALTEDRRARQRAIEASSPGVLGAPWSAVRYFSEEEDADDISVPVLRAAGFDPVGLGTFLGDALLPPVATSACRELIAAGEIPPYGVDLTDTHHGTCWRVFHIEQLAATGRQRKIVRRELAPAIAAPRLPIPRRPKIGLH